MNDPPTVFDDMLALLTPERVFQDSRATGEGVRVCLLDSGVERSVLEAKFRGRGQEILPIEGGVFTSERAAPFPYDGHQSAPHGTTVADILLTLAPRIHLYSADIFGRQGGTELDVLLNALHWAMKEWRCQIINLSLGVPEPRLPTLQRKHQLLRAIEDGYFQDVLIVAAAHNDHPLARSYPAAFAPALLSVDKMLFDSPLKFAYALRERIEFQAHGRGYLGPFAGEPATSWAAPHLAGIAARILSLRPGLKPFELKTILYWLSESIRKDQRR